MKSQEIREAFLTFFKQKNHKIVASAPMVIKNDPTLMFTNAGMNQFKDLFLGNSPIVDKRIADTQKCLRVSGKHNDLEEVGVDTYHHTMFEMLGNWSFGDYFKKEAIEWAWELLVDVYKIDKNRLYFTVFEGDAEDGTPEDTEAFELWKDLLEKNGLTTDKILKANKKDNFWEMGDTGPCGPCSEIHVDIRSDEEIAKIPGKELVNNDHPQVIEIWNLVFMEFNRMADGKLKALPAKHVDTGMGFERLAMVLQGKKSNYDTDVFSPLTDKIAQISGIPYKNSLDTQYKTDVAIRVIADHVRAVAFSIADGQLPSNNGAGYVIRRILRRAIRYGYSFLNLKEAFIYELVEILAQQMGAFFPELVNQQEIITKVIKEEEDSFLRTLDKGISRFENYIASATSKTIDGKFAFELYDTFGFPIDLTQLMATENGFKVDMDAFNKELEEQKNRSRAATKIETGDWITVQNAFGTEFIGYDNLESETKIVSYRKIKAKDKEQYQIVLEKTPFYPEGGGQVGDKGYLEVNGKKITVLDTKKENNLIVHFTKELPEDVAAPVKAVVSNDRKLTAANHSATHLLHQALRTILGTHVEQKGSLVNADYLRFDFSHFQKVSEEELQQIEDFVNEKIQAAINLSEHREIPIEEAEKQGAMMLFGEKYGDKVRMIQFGDSKELCGGIHVNNTKAIELFKITSEGSVAAGIRRIEAVTSKGAANYLKEKIDIITKHPLSGLVTDKIINKINIAQHNLLQQYAKVSDMPTLNIISPSNGSLQIEVLSNAIADFTKIKLDAVIIDELNNIKKAMLKEEEQKGKEQAKAIKEELLNEVKNINGVNVITKKLTAVDSATIKDLAFQLKAQIDNLYLVLGAEINGKPNLTIAISDNLATERKLHAGNIVREAAKEMQGGGGGQPFFATAGGANLNGLDAAMEKALAVLN
ncbi:MAG: alanine--tRNA ligase [Flavobacteriales bacterium]|nr:alanine--tRNA ligase [Flavobacteriales bacterium]MCW8912710.1 alanine--tRNA ligase [Flavobacteriales bacterium]MCW8936821.1 alanine--tRNA ligase [Flavobacteriales bacterium]MCW8968122.1 alanine--tRNA ligase [Flavobacteriales bacterium]MCW8989368.1 alanine--tRNA ligase [Flavobacteriales bacterium]